MSKLTGIRILRESLEELRDSAIRAEDDALVQYLGGLIGAIQAWEDTIETNINLGRDDDFRLTADDNVQIENIAGVIVAYAGGEAAASVVVGSSGATTLGASVTAAGVTFFWAAYYAFLAKEVLEALNGIGITLFPANIDASQLQTAPGQIWGTIHRDSPFDDILAGFFGNDAFYRYGETSA